MPISNELNDLHIGPTDITRPTIRCDSVLKRIKCHFVWAIRDYKSAFITVEKDRDGNNDYGTNDLFSKPFSATKDSSKWYFQFRRYDNDQNKLRLYLRRETSYLENLNDWKVVEIKCAIINSENQETSYCIRRKHLLGSGKEYYIGDIITEVELLKNENALLPQNKLTLDFEITFHKQEDMMGDYQESSNIPPEPIDSNLEYFGKLFNNNEFSDITIHVNGKEYPAHKSILVGRSPVFAAMLKHDMKESQTNRIDLKDIEEEIFLEALRFIYTGKVQNLETLAFELLPVADKYDLEKLKIMCGNVLSKKLSVETAVKILVLADMYHVENLKKQAINYIRAYSVDVLSKVDSEAWDGLMTRSVLMKEVFLACLK